ncbi:type III polyketide synthase [Citricoccus nitrophenolicus]|uniref:Putative naringenin-chalcone synthase n=1 Tax=Citricoccus muralis TaxID=169134 RepID=A0A3D9LCB8_9MICC|nr:type III polyketide synthase [Citricoccus muralis]REE03802.1 putative naringenin-chalcone synthase [Citricoccus muralis]
MTALLRSLHTAVPHTVLYQEEVRDVLAAQPGLSRLGTRLITAAFNASGIERRHTVVEEWQDGGRGTGSGAGTFFDPETGHILNPSTGVRNTVFTDHANDLYERAARGALGGCPDLGPEDVTHVITVSCTGFFSPGPDYQLVRRLGLAATTKRIHLGFMGCYAAIPALREAAALCEADPAAVVLVVSAELCTVHVRVANDQDTIVGASLFSDGAGAAIVTGENTEVSTGENTGKRGSAEGATAGGTGTGRTPALRLDGFATVLTPVGEEAMAWNIGDHGFEMILGTYVPHIIDEHITGALEPLLAAEPELAARPYTELEHWAIHPGGRSILDKVQARLELTDAQLEPARDTLRDYGNMSSATVLFVLQRILERAGEVGQDGQDGQGGAGTRAGTRAGSDGERVCAMAFGPGLTVESALMTLVG